MSQTGQPSSLTKARLTQAQHATGPYLYVYLVLRAHPGKCCVRPELSHESVATFRCPLPLRRRSPPKMSRKVAGTAGQSQPAGVLIPWMDDGGASSPAIPVEILTGLMRARYDPLLTSNNQLLLLTPPLSLEDRVKTSSSYGVVIV